jgi:hypothetical protein
MNQFKCLAGSKTNGLPDEVLEDWCREDLGDGTIQVPLCPEPESSSWGCISAVLSIQIDQLRAATEPARGPGSTRTIPH